MLSTSSGSCWAVNNYCPYKNIGPKSPADDGFEGGFSTSLMYKDLALAISAASESNTKIKYGLYSHDKYRKLFENGKGNFDFSYIVNDI